MKILQIVQQPQRRGAEMFAFDLTTELLARAQVMRTVYLYPAQGIELDQRAHDVALDADPNHPFERLPGIHPSVTRQLQRIVAEFRPDVVQANGARTLKYGAALKRAVGSEHPFGFVYRSIGDPLVWVRGWPKRAFYRRFVMPQVDGIAGVSSISLDGLRQLYTLDNKVVAQIPRGIDPGRLAPRRSRQVVREQFGLSEFTPVLVFVGSFTPEKRPDRLARVFADVVSRIPEARLLIVGEGPERGPFETQLKTLGVSAQVELIGASDDVGSYMAAANVLILTSDTEGLPGVVLEAACLGVPAISTNVGGVGDAITSGSNGILVDRDDEKSFVDACVSVLTDTSQALRLGGAAQKSFKESYSIRSVADSYIALYEQVSGEAET